MTRLELVKLETVDNILYVDFALLSMIESITEWYSDYYHDTPDNVRIIRKAHLNYIINSYDRDKFSNFATIGEERQKYLEEIDLYIQMRRED